MKIFFGADHAGFKLKKELINYLKKQGYTVFDEGAYILNKKDDYPDFAFKVAKKVSKNEKGILICGSAEGICIAANKVKGIRAVAVWDEKTAKLSRQHNDANILCLSGWKLTKNKAKKIVSTWLKTPFSKEKRHQRRINKIRRYEQ